MTFLAWVSCHGLFYLMFPVRVIINYTSRHFPEEQSHWLDTKRFSAGVSFHYPEYFRVFFFYGGCFKKKLSIPFTANFLIRVQFLAWSLLLSPSFTLLNQSTQKAKTPLYFLQEWLSFNRLEFFVLCGLL